jgi:hypothetical protein
MEEDELVAAGTAALAPEEVGGSRLQVAYGSEVTMGWTGGAVAAATNCDGGAALRDDERRKEGFMGEEGGSEPPVERPAKVADSPY